jgi:hypothetical protein
MDLVYYNPNGFGVDLRKVDCDVYVDNTYLGKFQLDTLMHIPRRSEFTALEDPGGHENGAQKQPQPAIQPGSADQRKRNHKGGKSGILYYRAV